MFPLLSCLVETTASTHTHTHTHSHPLRPVFFAFAQEIGLFINWGLTLSWGVIPPLSPPSPPLLFQLCSRGTTCPLPDTCTHVDLEMIVAPWTLSDYKTQLCMRRTHLHMMWHMHAKNSVSSPSPFPSQNFFSSLHLFTFGLYWQFILLPRLPGANVCERGCALLVKWALWGEGRGVERQGS